MLLLSYLMLASVPQIAPVTVRMRSAPPRVSMAGYNGGALPADTGGAADTTSLLLTTDLLTRMAHLLAQVKTGPTTLHDLIADSASYAHVAEVLGPFQGVDLGKGDGAAKPDAVFDLGAVAAKVPAVAAAFRQAQLAPAQYLLFAKALTAAKATDTMEVLLQGMLDTPVGPTDDDNVIWKNVAFLRAHRSEIDAMGMPAPPSGIQFNDGKITHFLDTTALAQHRVRFQIRTDSETNFPDGFLDSTEAPAGSSSSAPPLRVLFVGNSLTYFNTMPRLFSALAAHGLHRRVVVGLVSMPGASPLMLWATTDVGQVIADLPWDVVVVQFRPNGSNTGKSFPHFARLFTQAITAHHARTVLWTQFGDPDTPVEAQTTLDSTLAAATAAAGATVAPIPQTWTAVRHTDEAIWHDLYYTGGGGHPSALGSYLISLVLYRTITGQSPVGLPHTAGDVTVPDQTAGILQQAAAAVGP